MRGTVRIISPIHRHVIQKSGRRVLESNGLSVKCDGAGIIPLGPRLPVVALSQDNDARLVHRQPAFFSGTVGDGRKFSAVKQPTVDPDTELGRRLSKLGKRLSTPCLGIRQVLFGTVQRIPRACQPTRFNRQPVSTHLDVVDLIRHVGIITMPLCPSGCLSNLQKEASCRAQVRFQQLLAFFLLRALLGLSWWPSPTLRQQFNGWWC